jgi:Glycosyltransferases, probably involved in cell wall biogenesis
MVSIICCTMRNQYMDNIFNNYARQKYDKKEMIIVLNRDDMNINQWKAKAKEYPNVFVYRIREKYHLGKCLNYGIRKAKYDILAKFDDDDYYAAPYLKESLNALKRKRASVVGKYTSFLYFEGKKALMLYRKGGEKKYRRKVKGGTLVFRRSVWDHIKFDEKRKNGCDVQFLRECRNKRYRVYSVSKHNYVCVRRNDLRTHTQKTDTKKYMSRCKLIRHTNNYIPIITRV